MSTESKNLPTTKTEQTAPAKREAPKTARALIEDPAFRAEIMLAMPKGVMSQERFLRVALTAINQPPAYDGAPTLKDCTVASLAQCLLDCAQLGLEPGGPLGRAYIIPFRDKKRGIVIATLVIGYKGLVDLAFRSGKVRSVMANVVFEKDEFDYEYGLNEKLVHRPSLEANPGELKFAYAVGRLDGGAVQWTVLPKSVVMGIKSRSRSAESKYSPWTTDEAEMWKKTAIRRLSKLLPLSPEFHEALDKEDNSQRNAGAIIAPFEIVGDRAAALPPGEDDPAADSEARDRLLATISELCDAASVQRPSAKWTALVNGAAARAGVALKSERGAAPLMEDIPDTVLTEIIRELEAEVK